MKTPRLLPRPDLFGRLLSGLLLVGAPLVPAALHAASSSNQYQLFVGLDLEVPWKEGFRSVRNAVNRNLGVEIEADGELHRVRLERAGNLRMRRELKVSRAPVKIEGLNTERCYSMWNDPARTWMRAEITMESQTEVQLQEVTHDLLGMNNLVITEGFIPAAVKEALRDAQFQKAEDQYMRISRPKLTDQGWADRINQELDAEQFDAIEAIFDVSAAETIADAYVVLLTNYKVPGRTEPYRFIYTQAIGTVDSRPRRVRLFSDGLPPGYEIIDSSVHLYAYGTEYASNLSEKAVDVSMEQAIDLLIASHLSSNRGKTLRAQPIWQTAPANFRSRLDIKALPRRATLEIDEKGRVQAVLDDDGQPLRLTGLAQSVLTDTRYLPALENGAPVASTLRIDPTKYFQ